MNELACLLQSLKIKAVVYVIIQYLRSADFVINSFVCLSYFVIILTSNATLYYIFHFSEKKLNLLMALKY